MSERVYTVDELRDMILPLARRHGMAGASLFGSYARGEARPDSDIDVLLTRGERFSPLDLFAFTEQLYEASGKEVDVYERGELLDGPFRDAVLRDELVLYRD